MSGKPYNFFVSVFIFLSAGYTTAQSNWDIIWEESDQLLKEKYLNSIQPVKDDAPNIILIVADDLGKYDLSIYGNTIIQTPNIDALGKEGALFVNGYATAPICSPSRAGLLTGRYQQRFGYQLQPQQRYPKSKFEWWWFKNIMNTGDIEPAPFNTYPNSKNIKKQGLPPTEVTISEVLKRAGYFTACIGKWHLGYQDPVTPLNFGFDYQYGCMEAFTLYAPINDKNVVNARVNEFTDRHIWKQGRKGSCAILKNGVETKEQMYLTYAFFREAKSFISDHKNDPFFLYLPITAPHTPYQAPKDIYDSLSHIKNHRQRVYYSMIVALDNMIGDLMKYLEEEQRLANTLIIFTSDNGAALYSRTVTNYPLTGGKFTFYEGGINIPLIINYKGKISPNTVVRKPVMLFDVFPTITDAANIKLPVSDRLDGTSLLGLTKSNSHLVEDQQYFWYSSYNLATRKGNWKMIVNTLDETIELYDLSDHNRETYDRSSSEKAKVDSLLNDIQVFKDSMPPMLWPRLVDYELTVNGNKTRWGI